MKELNEENKLLSCPFCSNQEISVYKWQASTYWSIECGNSDCPLSYALRNIFKSKEEAEIFWSHRYGRKFNPDAYFLRRDI